jgi:HlyD family secretion protein
MTPVRKRSRPLITFVAPVAIGLLALGAFTALSAGDLSAANAQDREAAQADYTPPTGLDVRAPLPVPGAVGGAGIIEPRDRPLELSVEVPGVVATVEVVEGQRVEAGQVLLTLRSGTQEALLAAALADEAAARADLLRASRGSRTDDLAAAVADADAAGARAAQSADSARRIAALFAEGGASADEHDRAQRTAQADADAARAATARRASVGASKGEEARIAEARLGAATARREQAERALEQHTLRAPAAGEILALRLRPGEYTSPGPTGGVVLGDTSVLRARVDISERDAVRVQVGQAARLLVEGLADPVAGEVVSVGRRVGRKNVRTDDPTDRQDARFVEVVVELREAPAVPMGIRVDASITLGAP